MAVIKTKIVGLREYQFQNIPKCHVGNLTKSFQKLASFLKDNGKVFIHIITVRTHA
jgi:hypothetical protein